MKHIQRTEQHATLGAAARTAALGLAASLALASGASAQIGYDSAEYRSAGSIGVEIWTGHDDDYVYGYDDYAEIFFRTEEDAFVVVYGTDAYGAVHLLYPTRPEHRRRVHRDHVYRIDGYDLYEAGVEGLVHVEALACAYPLEPHLPAFFHQRGPRHRPHRVGRAPGLVVRLGYVVGDPYLAFAELRGAIVPRGCAPSYVSYATVSFSIGAKRYYPRYVCNDCHYGGWYDPYHDSCGVFEIRIDSFWTNAFRYYDRCQPRYYYWKRASVPVRYRHYKTKWSSKDRSDEMIRYFAAKSPRERDHLDSRSKPAFGRGRDGRDDDRSVTKPGRGVRGDGRGDAVRGGRDRPQDVRGKPGSVRDDRPVAKERDDRDTRGRDRDVDRPRGRGSKDERDRKVDRPSDDRRKDPPRQRSPKKAPERKSKSRDDRKVDRSGDRGGDHGGKAAKPSSRSGGRKSSPGRSSGGSRGGRSGGGSRGGRSGR